MERVTAIRWLSLYLPFVTALVLARLRSGGRRLWAACLVGVVWALVALVALQELNLYAGWWDFRVEGGVTRDMPVELWLGWAVLWGAIPVLVFRQLGFLWVVAAFFALDVVLMPACRPVVVLGVQWWGGEAVALALALTPALLFARWTMDDEHPGARAVMHVLMSGGLFLLVFPDIVFSFRPAHGWNALLAVPAWVRSLELQGIALLGLCGVSAVQEFATRGRGTPIPYDPPKQLVTSGVYRYIANPMQFSCALVMTAWGGVLRDRRVAAVGAMSLIYGLGVAAWDEGQDLKARFGADWQLYRKHVKAWRFRLTPWHDPNAPKARLYVAETCCPCSEVRRWFEAHHAVALKIVAAEDHPTRDLRRITYDPMDGSEPEKGMRAFARGLEHIHLGWALAGAALRLPVISHFVQLLMDASGLGPQQIPRRSCAREMSPSEELPAHKSETA
jgi:protein-S-isoprenylcysteine O-methyltransferase Ste14